MTDLCKNDDPELIKRALDILGDKYTARILHTLHDGPQRFKDFERCIDGISPRTLSQRLLMLEENGILEKNTCPDSPGRCQYELTQAGTDLDAVIHSMANWAKQHMCTNNVAA